MASSLQSRLKKLNSLLAVHSLRVQLSLNGRHRIPRAPSVGVTVSTTRAMRQSWNEDVRLEDRITRNEGYVSPVSSRRNVQS